MSDELDRGRADSPGPVPGPADGAPGQPGKDAGQSPAGHVEPSPPAGGDPSPLEDPTPASTDDDAAFPQLTTTADPNYILSQREFRATVADLDARRGAGDVLLGLKIEREADALITTAGWVAVSLGFWLLLVGFLAIRGELRGRPWRGA